MSVESWFKEFLPVSADACEAEDAIEHSIQKWEGFREENLKKHGVYLNAVTLTLSDASNYRSVHGCALCKCYCETRLNACDGCPLAIARNGYTCDDERPDEKLSPWHHFRKTKDPKPMLMWLQKAADQGANNES